MSQLYHNEDCTEFFYSRTIPEGKAGELIDQYVDVMAGAGVSVFLVNTNSRRTNYRSDVWEAFWDGYDPDGPDDQPFLAAIPREAVARYRAGVGNMLAVHRQGVDYPARVIRRCRVQGVSPWITLRMNDCHCNDNMAHPFHGSFWKNNPRFYRQNATGYFARCLDYAHPEVRDYFMALIDETLGRYDCDGLELDFMREPYLFSAGQEAEGAPILNAWLRDVRKRVADAGAKRGHPVRLGVRVPSRPEVAAGWGLDAGTWIKEGLIDLLVPTPRWETIEFDMPLRQWREMVGAAKVTLAGGLEIEYSSENYYSQTLVTPELAAGAASLVLSQGADAVYLFNYFQTLPWGRAVFQSTLKAMTSLKALRERSRTIGITYRDILGPGETYRATLPATGTELVFPMTLGPIPDKRSTCELLLGFPPVQDAPMSVPRVLVNGKPCAVLRDIPATMGRCAYRAMTFQVPMDALTAAEIQTIEVRSQDRHDLTVRRVEVAFRTPPNAVVV